MPANADSVWAADTSFAIAALDESHEAHQQCRISALAHRPALAGHAAFETYSVLTRLPGAMRVAPGTVADLLARAFPERCWLSPQDQAGLFERLATIGLSGGMIYDALVAEAARAGGRTLLTRDVRARRTYDLVGVRYQVVG